MSEEHIKLAEAYYAVAADLQRQGQHMLLQAEMLHQIADRICEDGIRKGGQPVPAPAPQHGADQK